MARVRIQPYGPSKSARVLSEATGIKRLKLVRTKFRPRNDDLIINWGSKSKLFDCTYWNDPKAVLIAQSKLSSLKHMQEGGVNVPEFTQSREVALGWLENGRAVVCRSLDRGSSGRGITLVRPGDEHPGGLPEVRLYTAYIPKYDEYRVHVWGGQILDVQQKRRRNNAEYNNQIRTGSNGWVFCRGGVEPPEEVLTQGLQAVEVLGLDFGASDVGFTRATGRGCVYEVNTAPGLEGTTLERYCNAVRWLGRGC